jgi:hypothetical protein
MTDKLKRRRSCYICQAGLDPLTSTCPYCGYSQTPNPEQEIESGSDLAQTVSDARKKLQSELEAKRAATKASLRSKLRKK